MKIALVIPSLAAGGAERVMVNLANYWASAGHQVLLITALPVDTDFYKPSDNVRRESLKITRIGQNRLDAAITFYYSITRLRHLIKREKPDVIISFIEIMNVTALAAMIGTKTPVIVSERIDPREYPASAPVKFLRRRLYPNARAVVVQTRSVKEWAVSVGIRTELVHIIPNPVLIPPAINQKNDAISETQSAEKTVIAMGRLVEQKGFDLLLKAFAKCAVKHNDWKLKIFGEGPDRAKLEMLSQNLGIQDKVELPGQTKEPAAEMRKANLFVLSSRYEGFPNTLCEAMACGLPVISTDCPSGPSEIIRHGIDGLLIPSENEMALIEAMNRLMSDEGERRLLASRAPEILERYGLEKVMAMWDDLLEKSLIVTQ